MNKEYTIGEKCADLVAKFGGSWKFIFSFTLMLLVWILYSVYSKNPFDPYPFILLNLILSCLAAVQAPFIMMSSNRQSQLDRIRDEKDFQLDQDTNEKITQILELLSKNQNQ